MAGSCCAAAIEPLGNIPSLSSNIYLMINLLLPPGLSESCWFCSHHNPPGYLVRSDCRLRKAVLLFPVGVVFQKQKKYIYIFYFFKDTCLF